jgi:hypothetical protein
LVNYRQAVAIIDTADPILFRFPEPADNGDMAVPPRRLLQPPPTLAQAVEAMRQRKEVEKARRAELQSQAVAQPMADEAPQERIDSSHSVEPPNKKSARVPLRGEQFQSQQQPNHDGNLYDASDGQSELPFASEDYKENEP